MGQAVAGGTRGKPRSQEGTEYFPLPARPAPHGIEAAEASAAYTKPVFRIHSFFLFFPRAYSARGHSKQPPVTSPRSRGMRFLHLQRRIWFPKPPMHIPHTRSAGRTVTSRPMRRECCIFLPLAGSPFSMKLRHAPVHRFFSRKAISAGRFPVSNIQREIARSPPPPETLSD